MVLETLWQHKLYARPTKCSFNHPEVELQITFDPEVDTTEQLLQRSNTYKTTLTAFFEACNHHSELAKDLIYVDFPTKFT